MPLAPEGIPTIIAQFADEYHALVQLIKNARKEGSRRPSSSRSDLQMGTGPSSISPGSCSAITLTTADAAACTLPRPRELRAIYGPFWRRDLALEALLVAFHWRNPDALRRAVEECCKSIGLGFFVIRAHHLEGGRAAIPGRLILEKPPRPGVAAEGLLECAVELERR